MAVPYRFVVSMALVIAEGSWIALALGLVALLVRGPVLSLPAVVGLLALGLVAARWASSWSSSSLVAEALGAGVGVVAIYLVLSLQMGSFWWPGQFAHPGTSPRELARMGLAVAAAVALWWRGTGLAGSVEPWGVLSFSFRLGLLVVAAVGVIDLFQPEQLVSHGVLFLFVAASLVGLALAHLRQTAPGKGSSSWIGTVGGSVLLVLLAGGLAGLLAGGPQVVWMRRLLGYLGLVAQVGLTAVAVPFAYALTFIMQGILWLLRWFSPDGQQQPTPELPPDRALEELRKAATHGSIIPSWLAATGKWTLLALLVLVVLYILARALLRRPRPGHTGIPEERRSVRGEPDPEGDLGNLMRQLFARRGPGPEKPRVYPLPQGNDPLARVARLYYRLLNAATLWGFPRHSWETPLEYQQRMEHQLPREALSDATSLFNTVRFGAMPPVQEELERVEQAVEAAVQQRPRAGEAGNVG